MTRYIKQEERIYSWQELGTQWLFSSFHPASFPNSGRVSLWRKLTIKLLTVSWSMALIWGSGEAGGLCCSGEESKTVPGNIAASLKIVTVLRNPSAVWMCFPCAWGRLGPGALAAGYCVGRAAMWAQVLGLLEREEREAGDSQGALFSLLFSFGRKWKNEMKIKDICKTGRDRCGVTKMGEELRGGIKKIKRERWENHLSGQSPEDNWKRPRDAKGEKQTLTYRDAGARANTYTHTYSRCTGRSVYELFLVTLIVTFNLRKEAKPTPFSSLLKLIMHPELKLNGKMFEHSWKACPQPEDALQGAVGSHGHPVRGPESWSTVLASQSRSLPTGAWEL